MISGSALLSVYGGMATALSVFAPALLNWRLRRGKEDAARLGERKGLPGRERPHGALAWLHGASVGEAVALLPLIEALRERGIHLLLTTGTVTSARLMQERLPAGVIHQYAPLDIPAFAKRFLDHWRPDLALIAESELWPNILRETSQRRVPLALVNGRLSERSLARWKKFPATIAALLGQFDATLAQTGEDARRFAELGAPRVSVAGNLKYDVPALPCDPLELTNLRGCIGSRPVWAAASTHDGEEFIAMEAHARLARRWPGIVTIVAPRHPERGPAIAEAARQMGLNAALRSRGETPGGGASFYVADTIGELGLFYRAATVVFLGRSLALGGGQNPIEPAKLGNAILHGPSVANFADVYRALDAASGAIEVADGAALEQALADLFADAARVRAVARAASETVEQLCGATRNIMNALEPWLPPVPERG